MHKPNGEYILTTMMTERTSPIRQSAQQRREAVLDIAIRQFAHGGYVGTATETISREAGISHPYLFKLFGSKKALFLAAYDRACGRIDAVLMRAADAHPGRPVEVIRTAIASLRSDRDLMLMLLQGYSAAADEDIRAAIRERERAYMAELRALGLSDEELHRWQADSLLVMVGIAIDLPEYLS